ncbi:hypothetical protein RclHR1_02770010 [Rhizophagus clarus]|uniref:Knl1 C-terminal RWD domain-containing protein n=1 Tax=Rhizophagus clarus TaxID=94130 RepID=A0A2Z6RX50_9GLOM|nr:hypothetical protein RclHR1_02770010 [Rhizophagus clarus]
MEGNRELRRSPRFNRSPKSPKRRRNSLLPPTKSILKKSEDTTNFDILQDENTTTTNVLGSLWESNTTMFTRNFDESEITENDDGQKRRKSLGRRVSFASKARVRLFDKDEATEKQAPEPNKSNYLNGNRDEASEFMLTISTPSPNNSMIEGVESSSSTSKNESSKVNKGKYAESPDNIISNDNQSTSQNMSQAQNSNTQMNQNNTTPEPMNDQQLLKDRVDTFAPKDMSLVSTIGPTSIEYRDTTSTSMCPCDMTLVSMVNQSPSSGNHEITNTSVDVRDMTLASMIDPSPSENCHISMDVQDMTRISMINQPPSENCTSMGFRDMTFASMIGPSSSENRTSMGVRDMTFVSMIGPSSSENRTSMGFRDMTLASIIGPSPSENCTSMGVRDMTLASMVGPSPSENCTSMGRDMTLASMVGMSPSEKDMTLASIASQSSPKSIGKIMTPTSMINRSPRESMGDKLTPIINRPPSESMGDKDMTLTSMANQSLPDSMGDKLTPIISQSQSESMGDKDMTLASIVNRSPSESMDVRNMSPTPSEIRKITSTQMSVNDITTVSLEDHSVISSEDMSLVSEDNVYHNDERTIFQGSHTNSRSSERRETAIFDVTDVSLINDVNVKLCDGTTAMMLDENIPINEGINAGDLNVKECQKSDFADTEEMKFMKAMIEEQNQQIEIFETELEGINKETQSLREMRDYLIKEKAEIEKKIRDAKRLVEETQCYTEEDLNEVQEQYRILIDKHKWFPKKLSEELVHLVYDETVQVKIDTRDSCKREDTNIPFVEVSLDLNDNMKYDEKLYYRAIFGGIQKFALNYKGTIEIPTCSRIVKPIAAYWGNSKQLYRDYRVLRFKLPTEIVDSQIIGDNEKSIIMIIRVNFFNYKAKTNFYIKFLFRWEDVISYPNISNLLWEIEIIYGKVNEPFIKETLNKHLSSNILGCIRDSCIVIQKNGFVF